MGGIVPQKTAYLALDKLTANPDLARCLPPDLAWRFHALPVAEERGCITVAMADPEDGQARDAVLAALGPASCIVRGDPAAIDALLAEIWGKGANDPPELTVCAFPEPVPDEVWTYARSLGDLLGARVCQIGTAGEMDALTAEGGRTDCDLVIFGKRRHPLIRRLLSPPAAAGTPAFRQREHPFGVLVVRQPRWPLRRILLVLWGEEPGEGALDWVARLAKPSGSAVTVLAVVPPVPAMYGGRAGLDQGLPVLLKGNTPLAQQMCRAARRLVEFGIEGTLRLRQGAPDWQIGREIAEGDYDLIALAAKSRCWWLRWLEGDSVDPLLCRVDRPVLIARPTTA
jgi:nucleotide-binding universal stress UspA family protein